MKYLPVRLKMPALAALLLCLIPIKIRSDSIASVQNAETARRNLIAEAKKYIGSPYAHGAVGPSKFDCSGFVFFTARQSIGCQLPRTSRAIYARMTLIADEDRAAGDLVFFKTASGISHVGIFIGDDQFISAVSDGPKTGVIVSSLSESYWKRHYAGAGRFLPALTVSASDETPSLDSQQEETTCPYSQQEEKTPLDESNERQNESTSGESA